MSAVLSALNLALKPWKKPALKVTNILVHSAILQLTSVKLKENKWGKYFEKRFHLYEEALNPLPVLLTILPKLLRVGISDTLIYILDKFHVSHKAVSVNSHTINSSNSKFIEKSMISRLWTDCFQAMRILKETEIHTSEQHLVFVF